MFNLGSSYFHVALTTVRHLLNAANRPSAQRLGQLQTCQVSRISRETHAFSISLTLSLRTVEISRIFLLNEKQLMPQVFSFCGEK